MPPQLQTSPTQDASSMPDETDTFARGLETNFEMRERILGGDLPLSLDDFDSTALSEGLVIGSFDTSEAQAQEELIERQRAAYQLYLQSGHEKALCDVAELEATHIKLIRSIPRAHKQMGKE